MLPIVALLQMIHCWTNATDGNGSSFRTILFDYRKAFDLIDHKILITKLSTLNLPYSIINRIIDFLPTVSKEQNLPKDVYLNGVWCPLVFLRVPNWAHGSSSSSSSMTCPFSTHYYESTYTTKQFPKLFLKVSQVVLKNMSILWRTGPQTTGFNWTSTSVKKNCISFSKNNADLPPLFINGQELEVVQNAKLLGVTITNNLSWNIHINETIKKTSKRLYFLRPLKRNGVSTSDLVRFYTCIRSVCDYAVPVFQSSLPNYLINDLEGLQKRALSIICPHLSYNESLAFLDMDSLFDHHSFLCSSLFSKILDDEEHKLHHLLPPRHTPKYNFRQSRLFDPGYETNRTKNSFINFQCNLTNNIRMYIRLFIL